VGVGGGGGGVVSKPPPRYTTGFNIVSVSKYNNLSARYRTFFIFLSIVLKSTAP